MNETSLAAVETIGLSKRYGSFDALADLNLTIPSGSIFGLLGPNGAGKTTFIRLLLGFLYPTGGKAMILGCNPVADPVGVRQMVSYLPAEARLPREMRGHSVLKFFAEMQLQGDLERSLRVADQVGLDLKRLVSFMSTGMRQKLAIAAVLGSHAPLIILDEPTANLDPTVRGEVLKLIAEVQSEGRTVIFSSHVMSEIEEVCDRVAFLRNGRLALEESMSAIRMRHRVIARVQSGSHERFDTLRVPDPIRPYIESIEVDGDQVTMDLHHDLAPMLHWLDSLNLAELRIDATGLRVIYDAVHRGDAVELQSKPAVRATVLETVN